MEQWDADTATIEPQVRGGAPANPEQAWLMELWSKSTVQPDCSSQLDSTQN